MGLAIVLLLAIACVGAVVYPLLPGRTPAYPEPAVTDGDIEKAVRDLRTARKSGGLLCPKCGTGYQAGDRFCVRCGQDLPQVQPAAVGPVCPSCGATVQASDQFCAKCGHSIAAEEAA